MAMRVRVLATTILAAAIGVTGLAGCAKEGGAIPAGGGSGAGGSAAVADTEMAGQALEALGFDTDLVAFAAPAAAPTVSPTAGPNPTATRGPKGDRREKRPQRVEKLKLRFGKRALHGEVVVETAEGLKTVVVQRGSVTAVTDTSITVKSTDGYTLTWTFGDKLRVVELRTTLQPKDVVVGTEVGVSGTREGDKPVARLIVIPGKKPAATPTK